MQFFSVLASELIMNAKRVSLGFDLRVNPDLQGEIPSQKSQRLTSGPQSPLSADPSVWLQPREIESLWVGGLPNFSNPLNLAKNLDLLVAASSRQAISIANAWPICVTGDQVNTIALDERYGPGYFDNGVEEGDLTSNGWQFMGFDVVDLYGLISGLKGCGYVEPTWSQLRGHFGSYLNELGLFTDWNVAARFAEVRGLQIREHAPFAVVGILVHGHFI